MKKKRAYRLLLLAGWLLLAGCAAVPALRAPEITGITPRITNLDLRGVDLEFAVQVANHYPVNLAAPEFRYALDIADSPFASGTQAAGIDLPAGGTGTSVLPVRVNYADLRRLYRNLEDAAEVPYRFDAVFMVRALGQILELPVTKSGVLPVLRLPEFSGAKLQTPVYSGGGARVAVDCRITNPNAFALGFEQAGFDLMVGTIQAGGVTATAPPELAAGASAVLRLTGEVSAVNALMQLLAGGRAGEVKITPRGTLRTPYGTVRLNR